MEPNSFSFFRFLLFFFWGFAFEFEGIKYKNQLVGATSRVPIFFASLCSSIVETFSRVRSKPMAGGITYINRTIDTSQSYLVDSISMNGKARFYIYWTFIAELVSFLCLISSANEVTLMPKKIVPLTEFNPKYIWCNHPSLLAFPYHAQIFTKYALSL